MKTITLSGPGKNSLSTALMLRAMEELRDAKGAPVFLTGEGDAFSAGLNLKELGGLDVDGMSKFLGALEDLVTALYEYPAPLVAWINGHAIAGGCVLALCADMRVMTAREGVRIGLNEVALGLRFPPYTLAMIRARLTAPALERVLLEGALHEAPEARHLGLVDTIGEEAAARAILEKLAAHPREVYASTKLLVRPRITPGDDARRAFRDETIPHWAAPERRAAILAMLEKPKKA